MPRTLLYTDQVYNLITRGSTWLCFGTAPGCPVTARSRQHSRLLLQIRGWPHTTATRPRFVLRRVPSPARSSTDTVQNPKHRDHSHGMFVWRAGLMFCTGSPYICPGDKLPQKRLTAMVRVHHLALLALLACILTLCTIDSTVPPCRGYTVVAPAC